MAAVALTRPSWANAMTRSSGNPGNGSDIVEGQDGFDTMVFNGHGSNENFEGELEGRGELEGEKKPGTLAKGGEEL